MSDYKVFIQSAKVFRLKCDSVTFNETESYAGRFKFTTTVNCIYNRVHNDDILRQNRYKVVVETWDGIQYLVSPEFDATYTSDFAINDEEIIYQSTFTTESNIPARIVLTKLIPNNSEEVECKYNISGINKLWVGGNIVDFLTCSYSRVFNGEYFDVSITYTIPVEDNNYHYDLINFTDNMYDVRLQTGNGDDIFETRLFPQYTIQTSEDFSTSNLITIILNGRVGSTLLGNSSSSGRYRWAQTSEYICDGFDKYIKEIKQYYNGTTWEDTGEIRKGLLIEPLSEDCGYYPGAIYRWNQLPITEDFECVGTNKHFKEKLQMSLDDGQTWQDIERTQAGQLYQANSADCGYHVDEWKPVDGEYICEEYEDIVEWVKIDEYYCEPVDL